MFATRNKSLSDTPADDRMKKTGILNADLSRAVAAMGHTDKLVVCDAGLPIPTGKSVVDLALTTNIPRFLETLEVVLQELEVERVVVADEMKTSGNGSFEGVQKLLPGVEMESVPHERFKEMTNSNGKVIFVRTGEATPYANIILVSGVTF